MNDIRQGTQVKTGDEFGIIGWWVNRNLDDSVNLLHVPDPKDKVPGSVQRLIYVYYGSSKPTQDEMRILIERTPPIFKDVKY